VPKFKHRVAVHRGEFVYYVAPAAALHLLDSRLATIRQKRRKVISAIELTAGANGLSQGRIGLEELGLQPGSFGIGIDQLESGRCYRHNNPWHQVVAA
jgi:hypothetical protein